MTGRWPCSGPFLHHQRQRAATYLIIRGLFLLIFPIFLDSNPPETTSLYFEAKQSREGQLSTNQRMFELRIGRIGSPRKGGRREMMVRPPVAEMLLLLRLRCSSQETGAPRDVARESRRHPYRFFRLNFQYEFHFLWDTPAPPSVGGEGQRYQVKGLLLGRPPQSEASKQDR